jgi:hypothetical protein
VRRASPMVVWPRWCSMMPPVFRNRRWSVSGVDGAGQDRQGDVEVDVERDGAGQGVQAEGLDGLGEALFDVHPPGVVADDLPGGQAATWSRYAPGDHLRPPSGRKPGKGES